MKTSLKTTLILAASLIALGTAGSLAQAQGRPNRFLPAGTDTTVTAAQTTDGTTPAPRGPRSPVIAALDANQDGEIDAAELANAAVALKALDTNNDGKLTIDEIRPARPDGARGPRGGGMRGKGGPRGGTCPLAPTTPPAE